MNHPAKLLLVTLLLLSTASFAGKPPVKFGEVSLEELKMTVYEADTSASAVILCDYGYFNPDNFSFTQITRIKILKKSGYSRANITFSPYKQASVKGITFNLENGRIVESRLESKAIFTETIVRNFKRIRITMPNVKVGSVVDIKFDFNDIPYEWDFQQDIPVKYSELVMRNSLFVSVRKNMTGYEPLKINDDGHWIAENMPAFKEEPYINSSKNYLTKLDFDLNDIEYKSLYIALTTTWEALCQYLKKSEYFGVPLRNSAYMNKVAKEINSKAKTNEDKLRLAHEFIKSYKWNKEESLYTSNSNINWALDKKSGSSADINLALVQLLDKLGFDVSPVLLSTRLNGMLSPVTPSLNKLNYVIACVNLNGEPLLMDGTEVNAPYNLLPERCLNLYGRRYDSEKCGLVDLKTDKKSKEIIYYNLTLDTGLQFTGRVNFQRFDYAALRFRNKYKNFSGKDAYLEDMLGEFPGLRIRSSSIGNIDSLYLPVKDHYDIVLKNSVEEINGSFYFYPMMLHRIKENPFKAEQRKYPIDFACNSEKTFSVTITIPENFEVTSFPESLKKTLPGNAAYFLYQVSIVGSTIQFNYKMGLNKTFFSADEYNILREFYNQIVAKQAEPIILKRKGT